jgi:MYXO-CTERM domain-containing protein
MRRRVRWVSLIALVAGATGGCESVSDLDGTDVGRTREAWSQGAAALRGHEDITRFAIEKANAALQSETGTANFFPALASGADGSNTSNWLMKGGYATDFPDSVMSTKYGVSVGDWDLWPDLQDLHFLRNWVGTDGVESAREACLSALAHVVEASGWAVYAWQLADQNAGLYWMGHATHVIQDSFALPHTDRSGTLYRKLDAVCSYGRQVSGVCFHQSPDVGDRVWNSNFLCQIDPSNRSWDCLLGEAQAAALATAGYLRVMGRYLIGGATGDLPALLQAYFTGGATDDYVDYFHCETLQGAADGHACTSAAMCQSGFCADGFCCNAACTGPCEQCDGAGHEGVCVGAAAGTDPRQSCRAATGGHLACNGSCNGTGQCAFPGATARCELCTACDGAGRCTAPMTDDSACGVIDCSGLDQSCKAYDDLKADRCQGTGACKAPNAGATCTSWHDTCQADAGSGGDGGGAHADGGTGGDGGGDGGDGHVKSGGCAAAAAPGGGLLGLLLFAAAGARRRRRRA